MNEKKDLVYTDSYGDDIVVYPKLNFYLDNNNLYVGLDYFDPDIEGIDSYCDVTVNLYDLPYLEAAIDTNNNGDKMVDFLVKNGFGELTGLKIPSGFCWFPVFRFNEEKLREIDPVTFVAYQKAHGQEKPALDRQILQAKSKVDKPKEERHLKEQER